MIKTFNQFPYYDDFKENKNFYRILFRPGRAVQARELTQLQSILHHQISKIGDHLFREGALIDSTATPTYDNKLEYVKLYATHPTLGTVADNVIASLVGKKVVGSVTGIRALVRAVTKSEIVNGEVEPPTIYVAYENKSSDGITSNFLPNEDLVEIATSNAITVRAEKTYPTGRGVGIGLNANYVYVKGTFVYINSELKIVSKYSNLASKSIGFQINERIITYGSDISLLDPAVASEGSAESNYYATGADRYQITVDLVAIDLLEDLQNSPENFVELIRVDAGGNPSISQAQRLYSQIGDELAKRTYEESGNYLVNKFNIQLREHKRTSSVNLTNGMLNSSGGEYISGNVDKISAVISPGLAYIKGYRTELPFPSYLEIDKARNFTTEQYVNTVIATGHYIKVTNVYSLPNLKTDIPLVNLYNTLNSTPGTAPSSTALVGTARIRSIEYAGGFIGTRSAIYHIWLFDIKMNPGETFARSVKSFFSDNSGFPDFTCDLYPDLLKLSGEVSTTSGSNILLGDRTLFGMELAVLGKSKDFVFVDDKYTAQVYQVANVINDTQAFLTSSAVSSLTRVDMWAAVAEVEEKHNYNYFQPLKYKNVKTISPSRVIVKRAFEGTLDASSRATISLTTNANQFFEGASLKNSILTIGTGSDAGKFISPKNIRLEDNKTLIIDLYQANLVSNPASTYTGNESFRLLAPVRKVASATSPAYKTLFGENGNHYEDFIYEANVSQPVITLQQTDGYQLLGVYMSNSTVNFGNAFSRFDAIDITDRYQFDPGQRDTYYDLATISLKSMSAKPTAPVRVVYSYFGTYGSGDYFSVDSYNIDYNEIPSYSFNGTKYNLSDVIDYRPKKGVDGTFTGTGAYIPEFMININKDFTFTSNITYYLPKTSIITLSNSGRFKVIEGSSRLSPSDPVIPDDSMPLFRIKQRAYVRDIRKDVTIEELGIKRYTMRDIRSLENRIKNVEYYTSLNLLEKATENIKLRDTMGIDRFKNGFVVDNFSGFSLSDLNNSDFNAAIDPIKNELRPNYFQMPLNLQEYIENDDPKTAIGQKIRELYNNILGREPEATGFAYWSNAVTSFTLLNTMASAFLTSEERTNYVSSLPGNVVPLGTLTPTSTEFTTPFKRQDKNYTVTGDILSLPYVHVPYIKNIFASSNVSVNPFGIPTFMGMMTISPEDILISTEVKIAAVYNDPNNDFKPIIDIKPSTAKPSTAPGEPVNVSLITDTNTVTTAVTGSVGSSLTPLINIPPVVGPVAVPNDVPVATATLYIEDVSTLDGDDYSGSDLYGDVGDASGSGDGFGGVPDEESEDDDSQEVN